MPALPYCNQRKTKMYPGIEIFGRTISSYGIAATIGILFAIFVPYFLAKKRGLDEIRMLFLMLITFASSLIGSHLLYGIVNYKLIITAVNNLDRIDSFQTLIDWIVEIFGGAVFYGGLITGLLGGWIYIKRTEKNPAPYIDMGATAIPLFHGFGRIGCFLSGCCYGVPSACGVTFHNSLVESANNVSRFPVQLAESALNFLLFLLLLTLFKKRKAQGKLMLLYLLIYPTYRFILEFFRGDEYRGFIGVLSTSQVISLLLFIFALIMLAVRSMRTDTTEK